MQTTVLVMARDRFIAVLLGGLIELSGRRVELLPDNEPSASAIRRAHPELVLFDCALGMATCSEIASVARLEGAKLLMFSAAHTDSEAKDIANFCGAPCFVLPVKPRDFMESLDRVMETAIPS
jgi:hypothetical protein